MENERKQKLLPYFAFLYSKEVAPDRYGNIESIEEWSKLIESDLETLEKINSAVDQLTDEDWKSLENRYNEEISSNSSTKDTVTQFAKNGAKLNSLKKLKSYKKGGKKCKCGCEMVITKEEGGKLVSKCACGCNDIKKAPKKEKGGKLDLDDKFEEFKKYTQKWERRMKSNKLKKFKE